MARQYNATGNSRHRESPSGYVSARWRSTRVMRAPGRCWRSASRTSAWSTPGDTGWAAAERALALQPDLAEAHAAKAAFSATTGASMRRWRSTRSRCGSTRIYEVNAAAARCYIAMRRHEEPIGCLERAAAAIETDFWALGMAIQCYEAVGDCRRRRSRPRGASSSAWRRSSSPSPITASRSAGA